MRAKMMVALLLAVMLVCSMSALAEADSVEEAMMRDLAIANSTRPHLMSVLAATSNQTVYDLIICWHGEISMGVDPYNSDYANQYFQACVKNGSAPEEVELARYLAAKAYNADHPFGPWHVNIPLNGPQLGDDSIPLSLLAGLAALALGGAVFAHRRCRQC